MPEWLGRLRHSVVFSSTVDDFDCRDLPAPNVTIPRDGLILRSPALSLLGRAPPPMVRDHRVVQLLSDVVRLVVLHGEILLWSETTW